MNEDKLRPEKKSHLQIEKEAEEKEKSYLKKTKELLENFLAKPDDPGISYEEQNRLHEESRHNPEAARKFLESKKSKYRINTLSAPLMAAEIFLRSSASENIAPEKKQELAAKIAKSYKDIAQAGERQLLTKEEVGAVVEIAKELLFYLK